MVQGTPLLYVNYNYRLGPLGFPQGQEGTVILFNIYVFLGRCLILLKNLAADRGSLNLALKDQLSALEWVQANIGAFGGDKEKVSISFYCTYE